MAYSRPSYTAADATWEGATTYTRPSYTAADATFWFERLANGTASGSSTVYGDNPAHNDGSANGSSTVVGQGLTNRGDGLGSGVSTVSGIGLALALSDGQAAGQSILFVQNAQNTANGAAAGLSYVLANNALVNGLAAGASNVSSVGVFLSRFSPSFLFPGMSFDGSNLIIPIADLPGLTEGEASSISGSWIDIFQAICIADHLWEEEYTPSNPLEPSTYDSWNNRNMNVKSSKFQYGVGELNTFLKHFTISYGITHLVDEN